MYIVSCLKNQKILKKYNEKIVKYFQDKALHFHTALQILHHFTEAQRENSTLPRLDSTMGLLAPIPGVFPL